MDKMSKTPEEFTEEFQEKYVQAAHKIVLKWSTMVVGLNANNGVRLRTQIAQAIMDAAYDVEESHDRH